jgi:hypothetical protein
MKTKLILISLCLTFALVTFGQESDEDFSAENFIAEVFYGDMTEESPIVYLGIYGTFPIDFSKKYVCAKLCFNSKLCDSTIVDVVNELYDYFQIVRFNYACNKWKDNAPVFQLPKYKNLIFVENESKLSKNEQKKVEKRIFTKPLFTKNLEYALINICYSSDYCVSAEDFLYKRINNKWVKIGHYITEIS